MEKDVQGKTVNPSPPSLWYAAAMEHLAHVVEKLSQARDLATIMSVVRKAARELTGADGATFILRDGDKCYYAEENAISPLWKGQRFPLKTCISGWVMTNRQPAVIEDIYKDPRIPIDAYRPTFVKSLTMMPIRTENPVGAIGNYWAQNRQPSPEELKVLQALANVTSVAMENVALYAQLEEKLQAMEKANYELSCFAWAASHDLKTPLRGMDNLARWIAEDLAAGRSAKMKEHLAALRERVTRMEKLLAGILEYAHLDQAARPAQEEMADGRTLKGDITNLLDVPEGFKVTFGVNVERLVAPRIAMQRILCNLIQNAIRHHDRKDGQVDVYVEEEESHYIINVEDDGPGIPPQYRQRIFEMFQTLRPKDEKGGSGLGLTIVKKLLALYGGSITVKEAPSGRGALFCVVWPKILINTARGNNAS